MKRVALLISVLFIIVFLVGCRSKNAKAELGVYYAYVNGIKDESTWIELKKDSTWESSDDLTGQYEIEVVSIHFYVLEKDEQKLLYTAELTEGMFTMNVQGLIKEYALDGYYVPSQQLFTLQFHPYNDSNMDHIYAYKGSTIDKPEDPIKYGYSFMGWYHNDILVEWPYTVNGDASFIAKWEEVYNLFNRPLNLRVEGSYLKWDWIDQRGLRPEGFEIYIDGELVSTQLTPQYELKILSTLWESRSFHFEVRSLSSIDGFIDGFSTLTYDYEISIYDVTLNYNDSSNRVETIQTNGGKINLPVPTKYGYQFNGWYTSNDGGQTYTSLWNSDYKVLENISLYADWVPSVDGGTKTVLNAPQAVLYGTKLTWPAISTATGYEVVLIHGSDIIYEDQVISPYYDFSSYLFDGDEELSNLTIKVRALGDGGFTTINSSYVTRYWTNSSGTNNTLKINYDLGVVYWESDESYYDISLCSTDGDVLDNIVNNKPEYVVPKHISANTYYLRINGQKYRFDYLMLAAPQNITYEIIDGEIDMHWDEVDKATEYLVYINDVLLGTSVENRFVYSTDRLAEYIDDSEHYEKNMIYIRSKSYTGDYFVSLSSSLLLQSYTLTLHLGNEYKSVHGFDEKNLTVIKGGTRTLTNVIFLENYRFCGWYKDEVKSELLIDNVVIVQSDLDFYAKWERSGTPNYEVIIYLEGEELTYSGNYYDTLDLNIYIPSDMTLIGLYMDSSYSELYPTNEVEITFTKDITLYAKVLEGRWYFTETSDGYILDSVWTDYTDVVIPKMYFGKPVYALGDQAFTYYGNHQLESVIIPDTVVSIGSQAFYGLSNLVNVDLPDSITYIASGAFDECGNLTYDVFNDNVLYLGRWFMGLIDHTTPSIILKDDTVGIYSNALFATTELSNIFIPKSVVHIGAYAFSESNLSSIVFSEDAELKYIGAYAFEDTKNLTNIQIPDNVEIIGDFAFAGSSLFQIDLSEQSKLIVIGESAFKNTYISSIYIPNHLEVTAKSFIDMLSINEFVVSDHNQNYTSIDGILFSKDMETLLFFPTSLSSYYFIPNGVKYIGSHAFYKSSLNTIIFPATLESIGDYAFAHSNLYSALDIPSEVEFIGSYAFQHTSLTSLHFTHDSKLETIGMYAFQQTNLVTVQIPNNVVSIQRNAFSETYQLTSVYIPLSVTYIGMSAFHGSSKLTIYTRHAQRPANWDSLWNSGNRLVRWNYNY